MKYLIICLLFLLVSPAYSATVRGQTCTTTDLKNADPGCCKSNMYMCSDLTGVDGQTASNKKTCCNKNSKCIWVPPSATESEIRNTCHTMTNLDCQAKSVDNCIITTKARHKTILSSTGNKTRCADHYTGSCSYECYGGTWYKRTNTCERICYATTVDNCVLPQGTQGDNFKGTCESGYTAYGKHADGGDSSKCWYYCNSKGQYVASGALVCLRPSCGSVNNACRACNNGSIVAMRCPLVNLSHGDTTSRPCKEGYSGTCNYTCNDGSLTGSHNCTACEWRGYYNAELRSMVQPFFSNLPNYPFELCQVGPAVYGTKVECQLMQRIPEGEAPKIKIKFTCKTDGTWETTKIQKYNNGWVDVN